MVTKRKYNIKGTNDFLVISILCFLLCVWCIRDAWFPTKDVLKRHPKTVDVSFPVDGILRVYHVTEGDTVSAPKKGHKEASRQLLAELSTSILDKELEQAKLTYSKVKTQEAEAEAASNALDAVKAIRAQISQMKLYAPMMGKEHAGKVTELLCKRYDHVKAGQPVLSIQPNLHFYAFNQSVAIVSFIFFWLLLAIHVFGR